MKHEYFGKLKKSKRLPGAYETSFQYGGTKIPLTIDPDDKTIEETLLFAVSVAESLETMENEIKAVATRNLLNIYNDNWREYQTVMPDGSYKNVTDPELSTSEFESKLSIESINVTGNNWVEYWFAETGLFAGHSVFVQSLNGLDLSDARAEMFG